jgi:hypothetical protein
MSLGEFTGGGGGSVGPLAVIDSSTPPAGPAGHHDGDLRTRREVRTWLRAVGNDHAYAAGAPDRPHATDRAARGAETRLGGRKACAWLQSRHAARPARGNTASTRPGGPTDVPACAPRRINVPLGCERLGASVSLPKAQRPASSAATTRTCGVPAIPTGTTQPGCARATMEKNAACGPAIGPGASPSQTHTRVVCVQLRGRLDQRERALSNVAVHQGTATILAVGRDAGEHEEDHGQHDHSTSRLPGPLRFRPRRAAINVSTSRSRHARLTFSAYRRSATFDPLALSNSVGSRRAKSPVAGSMCQVPSSMASSQAWTSSPIDCSRGRAGSIMSTGSK